MSAKHYIGKAPHTKIKSAKARKNENRSTDKTRQGENRRVLGTQGETESQV
jgi:hypothetical protein